MIDKEKLFIYRIVLNPNCSKIQKLLQSTCCKNNRFILRRVNSNTRNSKSIHDRDLIEIKYIHLLIFNIKYHKKSIGIIVKKVNHSVTITLVIWFPNK